jgi:hypothetical protein
MERFRLKKPTIAVQPDGNGGRMQFLTVPAGAFVQLRVGRRDAGLVDVSFDGRLVTMFLQDLQDRGERVRGQAS